MLTAAHPNPGYVEFINFVNYEMVANNAGAHATVIQQIVNTITVDDLWLFLLEIYTDSLTYKGVIACTPDYKLLYIENGLAKYYNFDNVVVPTLFTMDNLGITQFSDAAIPLYNVVTDAQEATLTLEISKEYGTDRPNATLHENNNTLLTGYGYIVGQTIDTQSLGCYNIKITKSPFNILVVRGAHNFHTRFKIELAPTIFKEFIYNELNEILYIQDTATSRRDLKKLEKEGVVYLNF